MSRLKTRLKTLEQRFASEAAQEATYGDVVKVAYAKLSPSDQVALDEAVALGPERFETEYPVLWRRWDEALWAATQATGFPACIGVADYFH